MYDINEFSFYIGPNDTLLVSTVHKSAIMTKHNKPINAIGKMMVFSRNEYIKLRELFSNLCHLKFINTVILSINLREDIEEEIFQINLDGFKVTYVEMGINYFIRMLNNNPARFFYYK